MLSRSCRVGRGRRSLQCRRGWRSGSGISPAAAAGYPVLPRRMARWVEMGGGEPQSPAPVDQVLWQRHTEPVSDLAANPRAFGPARVVALTGTRSRVRGVIPVVVMCLSALVSVVSAWGARDDRVAFAVNVLVPLSLVATGLLLRTDVQRRANASLCFWAAGFFAVSNLTYFEPFGVWLIGWSLGDLLVLPLTVLLLRYPGSRLSG